MSKTGISWCDEVWNPVVGCSAACDYCYARGLHDKRHKACLAGNWPTAPAQYRVPFGVVQLLPERLDIPLHRKKPTVFFVNSVSDLFDPNVPDTFRDSVYAAMALCPQHTFLVLTKRAKGMAEWFGRMEHLGLGIDGKAAERRKKMFGGVEYPWPLPNIWHGVTAENQALADERIPHLLRVPGKRFLSIEPMLSAIDLSAFFGGPYASICEAGFEPNYNFGIDAVLLGGESGPNARPMNPAWVRSVRDQCEAAGVPFFFKQWGEWVPEFHPAWSSKVQQSDCFVEITDDGADYSGLYMARVGKKAAGRTLDGRLHDDLPWDKPLSGGNNKW